MSSALRYGIIDYPDIGVFAPEGCVILENKYLISVEGTQVIDGERETEELTTTAEYSERGGKKLIKYREYGASEENPEFIVSNLIRLEENKVTLTKRYEGRTGQMIFECDKRHQCMYANEVGNLTIGIYTETINDDISSEGGTLEIDYTIDFNGGFESENHIFITLKKMEE